jgi:hypothetical protein
MSEAVFRDQVFRSLAAPIRYRSPSTLDDSHPTETARAARCGAGTSANHGRNGRSAVISPALASPASDSTPRADTTRLHRCVAASGPRPRRNPPFGPAVGPVRTVLLSVRLR